MVCRGLLLVSGLLFLSLTVCAQGKAFAVSELMQSYADEPAPIPAEPVSYGYDTTELSFEETAICPDDYDFPEVDFPAYIDDDYFVSEFECKSTGGSKHGGHSNYGTHSIMGHSTPAGFCVVNKMSYNVEGLPLPTGPAGQFFNYKLDAFCMLQATGNMHDCNLEAFEGAVLDVSGVVVANERVIIDRDPRQHPALVCAGEPQGDFRRGDFSGRTPGNSTETRENRRLRREARRKGGRRGAKRLGRRQKTDQTSPATGTEPPQQASVMGVTTPQGYGYNDDDRHYNNYASATPQTYYRGRARIYTGVVYASDPNGKGLIGSGTFEYVRPIYVPPGTTDAVLQDLYQFEILTSAQGKVYTPFQYNFKLTQGGLVNQQAYNSAPYSNRRKA